ncbi:MAG: TIGR02221 family CRISPR-associated protein [Lachnospiraceae bacterium]|nr:TIGR02221 family CRISPR-associated protein [Lachnospiraceae bacterium]
MSNVLLTSIGTGSYNRENKSKIYSEATYVMENKKEEVVSAYIYDALIEYRSIDKIIFIGTAGSNWHMMYEHLYEDASKITPVLERNDDYAEQLLELYETKTHPSMNVKEVKEKLQKLKETMGDTCLDIIVLHYGITEEEMNDNFNLLAEAKKYICDEDKLSFDMTHSFPSLAFYELLALNYFKLSMKNSDSIDFISYGMFDYKGYNDNKSPIIDQSPILRLLEWTKAADEYKRFGTTYLIDELVNKEDMMYGIHKEAAKALGRLGDVVTSNNLKEIRNMVSNCHKIVERGTTGNHAIDFIFKDIDDRFGVALRNGDKQEDKIRLYIKVALWHMEKKRYIASAITIVETMLNYCDEITGIQDEKEDEKKKLRTALYSHYAWSIKEPIFREFADVYNKVRDFRNKLCHALDYKNREELEKLKEYIENVSALFEKKLINNRNNVEQLKLSIEDAIQNNNKG